MRSSPECEVVQIAPIKKNPMVYQALLQMDIATYHRALEQGHFLIGFDTCKLFESINVPRCYKCNNFFLAREKIKLLIFGSINIST